MLVACCPRQPDLVARLRLAEAVLAHRNRLTLDLAKYDAVSAKMLDALDARRTTVLRHDADMLGTNLGSHFMAQLGIQIGQWFIHQTKPGFGDDGATQRDPLALTAGQLRGLAVQQLAKADNIRDPLQTRVALGPRYPAHPQAEHDVFRHAEVGK